MKFASRAEHLCAVALLLAFFLPWVSLGGLITLAGYQLPDLARGLGQLASFGTGKTDARVFLFYLVYLIPLCSLLTLYRGMTGKGTAGPALVAALVPLLAFGYVLVKIGSSTFDGMGIGAWLTLLAAVGMLLSVAGVIRAPGGEPALDRG